MQEKLFLNLSLNPPLPVNGNIWVPSYQATTKDFGNAPFPYFMIYREVSVSILLSSLSCFDNLSLQVTRSIFRITTFNNLQFHVYIQENLGSNSLHVTVGCQCNWWNGKDVSFLVWSRCSTLVGSIDKTLTIAIIRCLRPQNWYFWAIASIFQNLQRICIFYSHWCMQILSLIPYKSIPSLLSNFCYLPIKSILKASNLS